MNDETRLTIPIDDYDYPLPAERIARFPLGERDASRLLVWRGGTIADERFSSLPERLPAGSLLVFNDTKVIRARILFFKETGARIELFCLKPHAPADHERAFAVQGGSEWRCIVGNAKKWRSGPLTIEFEHEGKPCRLRAVPVAREGSEWIVRFDWDADLTFGQLLELLGRIPIPPYLCRESEASDNERYQTVYSRVEGSVAAPTAGLHFTERVFEDLRKKEIETAGITLHVGAGTFLPVKTADAAAHAMHTEHFEVTLAALKTILSHTRAITAVGTTSVRTLESLAVLGYRVLQTGDPEADTPVGQWEAYDMPEVATGAELLSALVHYMEKSGLSRLRAATRIMITPRGFRFRVVSALVTNFHQPKSTLLLLISAFVGEDWRRIYEHALANDYRFLSYGDSSLLTRNPR